MPVGNFNQYWLYTDSSIEFQDSEYICVSEEILLFIFETFFFSDPCSWCNQLFRLGNII